MADFTFVVSSGKPTKVNIDKSQDIFYRYKTPQLSINVIGKGKMIKTFLTNIDEVSKALYVPVNYLPAYFSYELGLQFNTQGGEVYISGNPGVSKLSEKFDKFIKEFVLCSDCNLPENKFSHRSGKIFLDCKSCGNIKQVGGKCNPKFLNFLIKDFKVDVKHKKDPIDNAHVGDAFDDFKDLYKIPIPKEENVEWFSDVSKDAVQDRMKQITPKTKI